MSANHSTRKDSTMKKSLILTLALVALAAGNAAAQQPLMGNDLTTLKAACHARAVASDVEKISEGESLWIAGLPVQAEAGYIGLSMGQGHSVVIGESSILEAIKEGDRYLVRVKAGTAALVRAEGVITLHEERCSSSQASASSTVGTAGGGRREFWNPCNVRCHWELRCGESVRYRICIPVPVCTSDCVWAITHMVE